jgi:hypothetical protein
VNFKEVKEFILTISRLYDVKTTIHTEPEWEYNSYGDVDVKKRDINLYPDSEKGYKDLNQLLSTFFHELAHIYCFENGIYGKFYTNAKTSARYAYNAELATDRHGERLMNCFLSGVKYDAWYKKNKKEAMDFLSNYYGV